MPDEAIQHLAYQAITYEIASSQLTLLAMTKRKVVEIRIIQILFGKDLIPISDLGHSDSLIS